MHAVSALSGRRSCQKAISIVTTLRKILLKEGMDNRHTILSIATPFLVFVPIYRCETLPPSSQVGRLFVVCLLHADVHAAHVLEWKEQPYASPSRLPNSCHVSLTRTAKASGYPRRSPGA
jgi:hypothetical protein